MISARQSYPTLMVVSTFIGIYYKKLTLLMGVLGLQEEPQRKSDFPIIRHPFEVECLAHHLDSF